MCGCDGAQDMGKRACLSSNNEFPKHAGIETSRNTLWVLIAVRAQGGELTSVDMMRARGAISPGVDRRVTRSVTACNSVGYGTAVTSTCSQDRSVKRARRGKTRDGDEKR